MTDTQLFVNLCLAKMASCRDGSWDAENKTADAICRRFGMVRSVIVKLAATGVCYEFGVYEGEPPREVLEALAQVTASHPDAVLAARSAMAPPSFARVVDAFVRAASERGVRIELVSIENTSEQRIERRQAPQSCERCGIDTAADLRAAENMRRLTSPRNER